MRHKEYLTKFVPSNIGMKLMEAGVHTVWNGDVETSLVVDGKEIELKDETSDQPKGAVCMSMYATIFDRLRDMGFYIAINPVWDSPSDEYLSYEYTITGTKLKADLSFNTYKDNVSYSWYGAADAAILKVLEFIKISNGESK